MPTKARHKVIFTINAIEQLGLPNALNTKYVKKIVSYKGLYEIRARISHRQERILYFQVINNHYYLLCGFTKTKPQDQTKAIKHAYKLKCEAERRFNHENS